MLFWCLIQLPKEQKNWCLEKRLEQKRKDIVLQFILAEFITISFFSVVFLCEWIIGIIVNIHFHSYL